MALHGGGFGKAGDGCGGRGGRKGMLLDGTGLDWHGGRFAATGAAENKDSQTEGRWELNDAGGAAVCGAGVCDPTNGSNPVDCGVEL